MRFRLKKSLFVPDYSREWMIIPSINKSPKRYIRYVERWRRDVLKELQKLGLAITLDTSTGYNAGTQSSYSFNHTVGSSSPNRGLHVDISIRNSPSSISVTSVSYNTVALVLTRDEGNVQTRARSVIYNWDNAANGDVPTGTHSVAVALTGAPEDGSAGANSYYGVSQSNPLDVTPVGKDGASVTTIQKAIVTATDGAETFACISTQFDGAHSAAVGCSTNWTIQQTASNGRGTGLRSTSVVSPAGSKNMGATFATTNVCISIGAFRPVVAVSDIPIGTDPFEFLKLR